MSEDQELSFGCSALRGHYSPKWRRRVGSGGCQSRVEERPLFCLISPPIAFRAPGLTMKSGNLKGSDVIMSGRVAGHL